MVLASRWGWEIGVEDGIVIDLRLGVKAFLRFGEILFESDDAFEAWAKAWLSGNSSEFFL